MDEVDLARPETTSKANIVAEFDVAQPLKMVSSAGGDANASGAFGARLSATVAYNHISTVRAMWKSSNLSAESTVIQRGLSHWRRVRGIIFVVDTR